MKLQGFSKKMKTKANQKGKTRHNTIQDLFDGKHKTKSLNVSPPEELNVSVYLKEL
jgi:hypothetical protein